MDIQLNKFLLADDIRTEKDTGKLFIVGLYPDDTIIIRTSLPYAHNSLSLMINISGEIEGGELYYELYGTKNEVLISSNKIKSKKFTRANFVLAINQFVFDSVGTYKVRLNFPKNKFIDIPFYAEHNPKE